MKILIIGFGGFIGAVLRFLVSKFVNTVLPFNIPLGTLFVNVVGSFVLGYVYTLSIEKLAVTENFRIFIGIGLLGAFTTFSTFSLESVNLLEDGFYGMFFLNVFSNVVLSIFFAVVGIYFARL